MTLLDGFIGHSVATPEAVALVEGERALTYAALRDRAAAIAACLTGLGAGSGARVAIYLDRGMDAACAIFGTLRAGASYVPLDVKNPPERLAFIVDDARVSAMIGRGAPPPWLDAVPWIDLAEVGPAAKMSQRPCGGGEDLAAILYTSGSTGTPKGVALSHRAMGAFADWAGATFDLGAGDRVASLSPFFFDLSVFDLFAVLSRGGCVDFVPAGLTLSPARFTAWLGARGITALYTAPALLGFVALKGNLAETPLPRLRLILFAGEVFATPLLMKLVEFLPGVDFYNLYGPTETNVCCFWRVDPLALSPERPIPIGRPACGAELRVDTCSGELRVRGPALFTAYWRDGRAEPALDGEGWYRTGDRVTVDDRGCYRFHGRLDRMIKCSGYRVEPAEIEAAIAALDGVLACAVVGVEDATAGRRPAAAVVAKDRDTARIAEGLRRRLPAYMLPCRYRILEALPRLSTGKVDYGAVARLFQEPDR